MAFSHCPHTNAGECMHCHSQTCLDCERRVPTRTTTKTIGSLVCLHCDGPRLAKLQLSRNEKDDNDELLCKLCNTPMTIDFGMDPSAFCHSCIYDVADRLATDLMDTQKLLATAYDKTQESEIERAVATAMGLPAPTRSAADTASIRAAVERVRKGDVPAAVLGLAPPPGDDEQLYTGVFRGGLDLGDDDDSE